MAATQRSATRAAALVLASLLLLGACGGGGTASRSKDAPSFRAQTLAGTELTSASFAGRPTVLWFWAPWCTICRAEAPDIVRVVEETGSEVTFVGVAGLGEEPAMEDFVDETGTGGFTHVVDDDGAIWTAYGVAAQPAFAFITADGKVSTTLGGLDHDELKAKVQDLTTA